MDAFEKTELSLLSQIGKISTSLQNLPDKLQRIVEAVAHGMGKEGASLFLLDHAGAHVALAAAHGLNQESVGRLSFPLGMGIAGWVAQQKIPLALDDPYSDPRFQYVPESGIERFQSLVAVPIMDDDRCLGVLFVLSSSPWSATSTEITLLTTVAAQISGVIKTSQLIQDIQQRLSNLATISEINTALASTLDLAQLLQLIARHCADALHAEACSIRLLNLPEIALHKTYSLFNVGGAQLEELDRNIHAILTNRVEQQRQPFLIPDARADYLLEPHATNGACSIIGVPLVFRDRLIGIIVLYTRIEGQPFSETDMRFLTTVANGAAVAIENAAMYERMEDLAIEARRRAQELAILNDIGTAMSMTLNLDRLLRIILTAATMGGSGLGFNRAILLLTNERTNTLQGMIGVGPTSWEEAGKAWGEVAQKHKSLMEWIQTGDLFEHKESPLNMLARSIRVPLDTPTGVLALTALNKQPYNVMDAENDPNVSRNLRELLNVKRFATVPLIAKDRVIGVILVDNMFNQRPITDDDIRFLTMFAHQAALAIENSIIYTNLETMNRDIKTLHGQLVQSEKMAALGAMMAEITHEIRNPLVSIGGFTRRLAKKLEHSEDKKYIDIILGEVARLEGIIHDNLSYIKEATPQLVETDINALLNDCVMLYEDELRQRRIQIEFQPAQDLPQLPIDPQQIKQAVINIIKNAMEAMDNGGVLTLKTYQLPERGEAAIEFADTGSGITPKAMTTIFNPYYTTKARGTGLGLPITNRIVKAHKGRIDVRNGASGGAVFVIVLPLKQP